MVVDKERTRDDEKAVDLLFGALADPARRDIFRRARAGRLSVSALAREYPISLAAVQKHVAVLERAELVSKHRGGRTTMAIESKFGSREGMEQVIEMGMEQGMVEALGQIDALLAGERA